jgi:tetratricopeptide (TPR) repeat protein
MARGINWLHITDWHVGQSHEWLWPGMREQFFEDLAVLSEAAGPWDIVFFSGDFTQTGSKEEFELVGSELIKLWDHLAKLGSHPILIGVPGNHDLRRPDPLSPLAWQSQGWHDRKAEPVRREFWNDPNSQYRAALEEVFSNYRDWFKPETLPVARANVVGGILPGDFSTIIQTNGFRLGVVGLNTTFLQLTDADYDGKLDIHTKQLIAACGGCAEDWRKTVDAALLVTHQPPEWLHPQAQRQYTEIYELGKFHGHFCGHLHQPRTTEFREAGGPTRRIRQGPSLFGLERWGISDTKRIFGYTAGKWDFRDGHGSEVIWPRKANETYDGSLQLGPDTGYRLNRKQMTVSTVLQGRGTYLSRLGEHRLVLLEKSLDADSARRKLGNVPRYKLRPEGQHRGIRADEQATLVELLEHERLAWIIADWGLGKDGFLACALERLGGKRLLTDVFRLQCGGVEDLDGLQSAAEIQLGMSLQEFLAGAAALPVSALIFDDVGAAMVTGNGRRALEDFVTPILDFCPTLQLVFVARQPLAGSGEDRQVVLAPLEVNDIASYLRHHSQAQPGLERPHLLDRIQMWSGGLPIRLDQFLEELKAFSLSEILEEDAEPTFERLTAAEPVPRALRDAVASIAGATEIQSNRSYKLLKVLTVLRDGETYQSIKRFYTAEPFFPGNVTQLIQLGLLEAVPISQTAAELSFHGGKWLVALNDSGKLLRVPRQVRDYMSSLITDEERADIIRDSTFLLFGRSWWRGKIKLRNALFSSYSLSAIVGPGNEHVVARHLLTEALKIGNKHQIGRAIRLGLGLCGRLLGVDRFRDAAIACGAMVHLLRDTGFKAESAHAARLHAEALRMMDRHEEALEMDERALTDGSEEFTDEVKAGVHINMALALKKLGRTEDALAAAKTAYSLVEKKSSAAHQAESIIADLTLRETERMSRLVQLEASARNRGHTLVANNIALDLAGDRTNVDKSLKLLDTVIRSAKDNYNRTRAIIEKATILNQHRSVSDLSEKDRQLLGAAYSYSYAQRIDKMLDRCHRVLWAMMLRDKLWAHLLRLFRFSSFIWRLKGGDEQETTYLRALDVVDIEEIRATEGPVLMNEVLYLERRRRDQPSMPQQASVLQLRDDSSAADEAA